jgi:uncharacterized protein (DUF1330 family)
MSAYYILTQTVIDLEKYTQAYIAKVVPLLAKHKAEVLVADFDAKPLQGDPAKSVVVIRFPSEQAIRDFLHDPDYQPILKVRISLTKNGNAVMAPEFTMPG